MREKDTRCCPLASASTGRRVSTTHTHTQTHAFLQVTEMVRFGCVCLTKIKTHTNDELKEIMSINVGKGKIPLVCKTLKHKEEIS